MAVRINDTAPDFTAESTAGTIRFHDWVGDGYAIIFSHPKDFTPVCTTEFGAVAQLANFPCIGVSCGSHLYFSHHRTCGNRRELRNDRTGADCRMARNDAG